MRVVVPCDAVQPVEDCLDVVVEVSTETRLAFEVDPFDDDCCAFFVDDNVDSNFAFEDRAVPRFGDGLLCFDSLGWRVGESLAVA